MARRQPVWKNFIFVGFVIRGEPTLHPTRIVKNTLLAVFLFGTSASHRALRETGSSDIAKQTDTKAQLRTISGVAHSLFVEFLQPESSKYLKPEEKMN
jgi:hypothetical protein